MARRRAEQLELGVAPQYRAIAVDPPWIEEGGGGRGTGNQYDTLDVEAMPAVITGSPLWRPWPNAHLWMWATAGHLEQALWLIRRLRFRYVTNAVWDKREIGMGQYLRLRHEHLLFAVRGDGMHPDVWKGDRSADVASVFDERPARDERGVRIHSRKPGRGHELIERVSRGPYAELFARDVRAGWDVWGNEVAA